MQLQHGCYALVHFGPEVTFSRALKNAGYNPAIFKFTKGATNLSNNWKAPGSFGFYDDMVAKLAIAYWIRRCRPYNNIKGFIWIQGEADETNDARAAAYHANLSSLLSDMRTNVTNNSELPIILGVDEQHGRLVERAVVLNTHQGFAEKNDSIRFTSMHSLEKAVNNITHLSLAGLIIHVQKISYTYLSLISGETIKFLLVPKKKRL